MSPATKYLEIPQSNKSRKIAYIEWGEENSDNVLICVHGLSRNAHDFDFIAGKLCDNYRIISIDMAGRGKSDWLNNKSDYNYKTYISDIYHLIYELNLRRIDWLGTSMGGIIGMVIAAQSPELIHKIVINDIGPYIPGEALERIMSYVGKVPEFDRRQEAEDELRERMKTFGVAKETHWKHIFMHTVIQKENGMYSFAYDPAIVQKIPFLQRLLGINIKKPQRWLKIPDVNLWKFWNKIRCPILVVRGSASDVLTQDTLKKMQTSNPQVTAVELPGIGHAPTLMDREQIEMIRKWLAE